MTDCDVLVSYGGSICLVKPMTAEAQAWCDEYLSGDEVQHWCGAVVVEPRYLEAIVTGMHSDGLTVKAEL